MNSAAHKIFTVFISNLIFIFLCSSLAFANDAKKWGNVLGYVRDRDSQKPISYANVFLLGSTLGSMTNAEGLYKIEKIPPGRYSLVVKMMGYRTVLARNLLVKSNDVRIINISMRKQVLQLDSVKVEADRNTSLTDNQHALMGTEILDYKKILSSPGTWDDASRAFFALPSVKGRNDLNTLLYIRGGSPDQNLVLYDGLEILNPSRLFLLLGGGVSICNPDVIQSVTLSPGGFGAEHGNKMSALMQIKTRSGRRDAHSLRMNAGLVSARTVAEGPLANGRGGWLFAGRRSFYDVLANNMYADNYVFPFYYDIQTKIDYDFSSDDKLALSMVHMGEGAKMTSIEGEDMDVLNKGQGDIALIKYHSVMSPKLSTQLLLAYYQDTNNLKLFDTNNSFYSAKLNYRIDRRTFRGDLHYYPSPSVRLSSGIQVASASTKVDWNLNWRTYVALPKYIDFNQNYQNFAYYLQGRLQGGRWAQVIAGLRYDYSTLYNEALWSPRIRVNFEFSPNSTLWVINGNYYQFPNILSIIERGEPLDISRNTADLHAERAVHNILGLQHRWGAGFSLKAEIYEKRFYGLLVARDRVVYLPENSGKGYARGLEISFAKERQSLSNFGFWCNYSLSVARYHKNSEIDWRYFDFDQRHTLAMGVELKIYGGWNLSGIWYFGTGFPYTPLTAFRRELNSLQGILAGWQLLKAETNSARYPNYNRFDMKLSYSQIYGRHQFTAYLDLINVFNNRNVYLYEWDFYQHPVSNGYIGKRSVIYMLPFIPSIGISFGL